MMIMITLMPIRTSAIVTGKQTRTEQCLYHFRNPGHVNEFSTVEAALTGPPLTLTAAPHPTLCLPYSCPFSIAFITFESTEFAVYWCCFFKSPLTRMQVPRGQGCLFYS